MNSSEFLDRLTDFLSDTSGISTQELREDLEAKGIDVDALLERVHALLEEYGIKSKRGCV